MSDKPDEDTFEVSFGSGATLDITTLRERLAAAQASTRHIWCINICYVLTDPDEALESMELGQEQFLGVSPIVCLLCNSMYEPQIRNDPCSLNP